MRYLIILLALSSCMVGPNYEQPQPFILDEWHADAVLETPETTWWSVFEDPLLDLYVTLAVGNNPSIYEAKSKILQARALRIVAAAPLFPQISADMNASRSYFSKNGPLFEIFPGNGQIITPQIPQLQNLFNATLDATWEIDFFGKTQRTIEQADAMMGVAIAERNDLIVTLLAETARTYIRIRSLQARGRLIEENIDLLTKMASIAKMRHEKGLTNSLDYDRLQAELLHAKGDLPPIIAQIFQQIYALSVLTGQLPETLLSEMLPYAPLPLIPKGIAVGLRSDLLRRRPDIRIAERELAAATAQVGVAVASFFPSITLTSDIGFQSLAFNTLFKGRSKTWAIGADINLPIFSGGALVGNFEAAYWGANAAAWHYQRAVLHALEDTESALVAFEQNFKAFDLYSKSARLSQKVTSLQQERYKKGLINLTDSLDSERQYIQARLDELDAQAATLDDIIRLYKALGGGWEVFIEN